MNKLLVVFASGNLVAETEKIPDTGTGSLIIRLFLSLVLIIGLIYLSLFLLKKSSLWLEKESGRRLDSGSGKMLYLS